MKAQGPKLGHYADRGAGTVLTALVILGIGASLVAAAWAIGWMGSVRRAERVADLAALAAAVATVAGQDGCEQARQAATRNGGVVSSCRMLGQPPSFVVRVEARVELRPRIQVPGLRGIPRTTTASAAAGPG